MTRSDVDARPVGRIPASRRPRYELRLLRLGSPDVPVAVRSRHRFRVLAEWSRRLDLDHVRLLPGCELTVVDLRR